MLIKVLINGLLLTGKYSGVQYSIEYLIQSLSNCDPSKYSITVLVSTDYKGNIPTTEGLKLKKVAFNSSCRLIRIAFENIYLPYYLRKYGFNIYHSPGYTLPFFCKTFTLVTIHDLIALEYPALCKNETALYFGLMLPRTIKQADKIVTVSIAVKNDIQKHFQDIKEEKIEVIYHGLHSRFSQSWRPECLAVVCAKYNLQPGFLLFVGNIEPKKNLESVLHAYHVLKQNRSITQKLVIIGQKGWKYKSVFNKIRDLRLFEEVVFLNYVEEVDLPALYRSASALLFPSIYEGFGLPVLEAMACGCPVITSSRGALPEISGGFATYVDPYNIHEISEAMLKPKALSEFPEKESIAWAKSFSWKQAGERYLQLYSEYKSLIEKQ